MDLTTMTDDDLDALRVAVLTEIERRRTISDAPAQAAALADRYAAAIGRQDGDPWQALFVEVTKPAPPGPTVAAWSATATYKVGDRCTVGGRTYQCMVAHGAEYQGTWTPPNVSVWADVGPA